MNGWPNDVDKSLKAFHTRRCELSVERGCVLWGTRVVLPVKQRRTVLKELHSGHQGVAKMKALARKYVWWPKIDLVVEQVCKACECCQMSQRMPRQVRLHAWEFPGQSWKRLDIEFAGPFLVPHLHDCCGCLLQVAGGFQNVQHHLTSHHHKTTETVCSVRSY